SSLDSSVLWLRVPVRSHLCQQGQKARAEVHDFFMGIYALAVEAASIVPVVCSVCYHLLI
ncbi:unnamed protein product, partial [Ixodes persulcatus]